MLSRSKPGQLTDPPKVKTIREFRVDDADSFEVVRLRTPFLDLFTAGDEVDVTGVSAGRAIFAV